MFALTWFSTLQFIAKRLPSPIVRMLDAWSYRVARARAQRRREKAALDKFSAPK